MTLDVTIGKIIADEIYDDTINPMYWIKQCPDSETPICDIDHTLWIVEAYRSGSTEFWNFFFNHVGKMYKEMRSNPNSNDRDVVCITPFLDRINSLNTPSDPTHADRMKWLKYWCNKAVELYGKEAGMMFT